MAERNKRRERSKALRQVRSPDSTAHPKHEFSSLDNQRFTRLAGAMQFVAVLEIACGLAFAFIALPSVLEAMRQQSVVKMVTPMGAVLVPPIIGAWTYRAAEHFRLIVSTEGDDIGHLMAAMGELTKLYILQMGLWLVAIVAIIWMVIASGVLGNLL